MQFLQAKHYNADLYGLSYIENSITQLLKQSDYLSDDEKQQLIDCCFFASNAHEGQKRRSGEPYICHPIKVAEILAKEVKFDLRVLEAAILHDVIEDTPTTKAEVAAEFSDEVADLVDGVSKLDKDENVSPQELQAKTFEKLVYAMEADPRVVMIKFADRMHNMQTLDALRPEKRRRIAQETLDVYVPIASRLGMYIFKTELEELAFKHVHPWRYHVIQKLLKGNVVREETANAIQKSLNQDLQAANIRASVRKRRRNLLNVYKKLQKMRQNRRPLEKASIPFIVITDSIDDCYRVLGVIHQNYTPIFKKLTDYIASPKVNGYQSIHTSVLTKDKYHRVINFQIRTKQMHSVAESGIIAIWRNHNENSEESEGNAVVTPKDKSMRRWLGNIKNLSLLTMTPIEYYEAIKRDLTGFDIQVFTPKGEAIALPEGATVIDFAYYVHTDLGDHLERAEVNGVPVAVDFVLNNGQTVELFANPLVMPKSKWLKKVKTARARTAIRHFLRHVMASEMLENMGFKEVKKYAEKRGDNYPKLREMLFTVAEKQQLTLSELLTKIALHDIKRSEVLNALRELANQGSIMSKVNLKLVNQPGVLAAVSDAIALHDANILRMHFPKNMQASEVVIDVDVQLTEFESVEGMIASLHELEFIKYLSHEENIQ